MTRGTIPLEELLVEIRNGLNVEQFDMQSEPDMLPITRIETISNGTIDISRVKYGRVSKREQEKYSLQKGDILFSHINSPEHIGKTALFVLNQVLVQGINLLLLRAKSDKCDSAYLTYYLKSSGVRALFRARCKKAVNQASLNHGDITSLQVPLPSLPEQRRIAAMLDKADRVRRQRRYALELSETYLQAVFLEMFGDPITNSKGWERVPISDLGEVQTGNTPSRDHLEYYGDFIE